MKYLRKVFKFPILVVLLISMNAFATTKFLDFYMVIKDKNYTLLNEFLNDPEYQNLINIIDPFTKQTPLMMAASENDLNAIRILVENGHVNVNVLNEYKFSAAFYIDFSQASSQAILDYLIQHGLVLKADDGVAPKLMDFVDFDREAFDFILEKYYSSALTDIDSSVLLFYLKSALIKEKVNLIHRWKNKLQANFLKQKNVQDDLFKIAIKMDSIASFEVLLMLYEFIGVDLLKDKSWIESSYASMAEAHAEMLIIQYILPSLKIKANKNDEFFGMALQRGLESVLSKVTGYTPFQVGRVEGLFENNTGASFCTDLSSREPLLGVKACKYVFEVRDGTVIDVGCKKNLSSYLQSDDSVVLTVFCKNINKVVRQFFSPDITMTEFKNAQDVCTKNGMSCAYVEWSATAKCIDQLNERECFMESIDLPSFYSACTLSNNRDGAQILESAFKDVQREIVCEK